MTGNAGGLMSLAKPALKWPNLAGKRHLYASSFRGCGAVVRLTVVHLRAGLFGRALVGKPLLGLFILLFF